MGKVVGYIRVSTKNQAEEGISIEAQASKIKAWAEIYEYDEVEMYIDAGISGGKTNNRPELKKALSAIKKGDVLVVYSLSRLARSTKDTIEIADFISGKNADLASISEKIDTVTAAGKMLFKLIAVLAEFERDQVSERIKLALDHKKEKGEKRGGNFAPFGYNVQGKKLIKNQLEQEIIDLMFKLRDQGYSYQKVANALNEQSKKRKAGGKWGRKHVFMVMQRESQDISQGREK